MRRVPSATIVAASAGMFASGLLPLRGAAQELQPQGTQLQEVVVTAEKITQRLQDVPASLQVLSDSTIQDADVSQISDVVMLTTGLDYSESFGRQSTNAVIRGVAAQFLSDPTVVTYVDGFTLGFTRLVDNSLLTDLERIEVLKGPQATLYGFDALGGVINYITKKPTATPEASFGSEYGSYESYKVTTSLSGPIWASERLYGRVAVGTRGEGGTVDNLFSGAKDVNPEHDFATRGSLRWVPIDSLELNAAASYSRSYDGCGDCSHIPPGWNFNQPNLQVIAQHQYDWNDDARTADTSYLGGYHTTYSDYVLNAQFTQPAFVLTSITGYGSIHSALEASSGGPRINHFGGVPGYLVPDNLHAWSEELRIASNRHGRLTYLAGLYAYQDKEYNDLLFGPFSLGAAYRSVENYAAYLNADYALSRQFTLSAGVRYDDNKQGEFSTSSFAPPLQQNRSQKAYLPRYSLTYKPSERMDVYGLVSRGYHAGGFNSAGATEPTYQSEFVWNYEVGVKGNFWNHRLQTQLDAFYMDWNHQQLNQSINLSGIGTISQTTNAGESRITGEELAAQWAASERLDVAGSLTFLDSKYKTYQDPVIAPLFGLSPNLDGKTLPYSPRAAGSLSLQYLAPLPGGGGAWQTRLRADVRYTDSRFFDPTDLIEASAYWLSNLYAGIQNEHFEVGVYADNVFNQGYLTGGTLPDAVFPPEVTLGQPRIIGVRFDAHL